MLLAVTPNAPEDAAGSRDGQHGVGGLGGTGELPPPWLFGERSQPGEGPPAPLRWEQHGEGWPRGSQLPPAQSATPPRDPPVPQLFLYLKKRITPPATTHPTLKNKSRCRLTPYCRSFQLLLPKRRHEAGGGGGWGVLVVLRFGLVLGLFVC